MIDETEKPKIPSKFAKRAARYNEFGYKIKTASCLSWYLEYEFPAGMKFLLSRFTDLRFKETQVLNFYIQPKQKSITTTDFKSRTFNGANKEWPTNFNLLQKKQ